MAKSVVVIVERRRWINKYRAWLTYTRKYMAHDSLDTCNVGDVIEIEQLPQRLSRCKAFNVVQVIQREKIVMTSTSDAASAPAAAAFRRQPTWAGLSPVVLEEIRSACREFGDYYSLSRSQRSNAYQYMDRYPGPERRLGVLGANGNASSA